MQPSAAVTKIQFQFAIFMLTIKNFFIIADTFSRDERSRCEIASAVQHRGEEVRRQDPDFERIARSAATPLDFRSRRRF